MNNEEMKTWIDNASYEELLKKWRYAKSRDPFFFGEIGQHYKKVVGEKKSRLTHEQQVAASKSVGW